MDAILFHILFYSILLYYIILYYIILYYIILELAVLALARIMCANIHSQNGTAILAQALLITRVNKFERYFYLSPRLVSTAMSGAPTDFDGIIPEETQGPMPVGAPSTLASRSLDSFHRVEAVMKDENVSTGTLDSQDWEMVTEMVEDTENAATHFSM